MTTAKIEFRMNSTSKVARARIAADLKSALGALRVEPTSVRATFEDENGPKGGEGIQCTLEVRMPRRRIVHVAGVARTPRLAFDGALAKLERMLARRREVTRESKRRPKKYFVARRVLAS